MGTKTALITGISGQDGSYLAELLLDKGYKVTGVVRNIARAKSVIHAIFLQEIELAEWNMLDQKTIDSILHQHQPSEIYNLAAYSSGSGMFDDPVGIGEVNGLAVTRLLEGMRRMCPRARLCQASSREIFGEALESPQTENTPVNPRSPYGAAKLYADSMIKIYRQRYGIFACSAILFNHESERRSLAFVSRKITRAAVEIKLGFSDELRLGNLDAQRDWGFAGDYVRGMWLMLQQHEPDDFVLATGKVHTVRDFCEIAFRRLGLDYRAYVREDRGAFRSNEPAPLVGATEKARNALGWIPELTFEELVDRMVDADYVEMNRLS